MSLRVFTASLHEQENYPAVKPPSSLDVGLARGTGDDAYLSALDDVVSRVLARMPDLVVYLAGADPYEDDQLGRLALTREGLRRRDRLVFQALASAGVPVVVVLGGGYARHIDDTVAIHVDPATSPAASCDCSSSFHRRSAKRSMASPRVHHSAASAGRGRGPARR